MRNMVADSSMKRSKATICAVIALTLTGILPAYSDWRESICSPDGSVEATVSAKGARLSWRVARNGVELFSDSEIGLEFKDQRPFGMFKLANRAERTFDTSWKTRLYKKRVVRDCGRELKLELTEAKGAMRRLDVYLRAYDGAVALRYGIPAQPGFERFVVTREKTAFRFVGDPLGWFTLYPKHKDSQEQAFFRRSILSIPDKDALIGFPAIIEAGGQFVAVCEADLTDWAGLFLKRTGAWHVPSGTTQLEAAPTPRFDGDGLVVSSAPRVSPWRVVILGDTPAELTEHNDVILNLNPPPEGGDAVFDWVTPGVSAWDWWARPKGVKVQMTKESKCAEIDFAAEMGWPYYTIDAGWQAGKSLDHAQDLTLAKPELDLDAVLAHAKEKGVGVFLWAYWSVLESNGVERVFSNMSARGVKGFKVDFMDRQDQEMVNWYEKVVRLAAKYRLLINFHGAFHPTGMNRTWPNQITREAVAGNECYRYGWRLTPELTAALPFTRFLIGPADYTPGGFNNVLPHQFTPANRRKKLSDKATPEVGTRAHALALCVAYDSPLMTLCDIPENYQSQKGLDALRNLPAAWEETHCLGGEIGSWYAVARKAQDGRRYLAVITADARRLTLPLAFLESGNWQMTLYTDEPSKNKRDARAICISQLPVCAFDRLELELAHVGGAVAIFERR